MKRILASLIIMITIPMLTQPTLVRSKGLVPLSPIAFAGHTTPVDRAACPCDIEPDGACPCCGAGLSGCAVDATPKHARRSTKSVAPQLGVRGSFGMTLRTVLSVIALLYYEV